MSTRNGDGDQDYPVVVEVGRFAYVLINERLPWRLPDDPSRLPDEPVTIWSVPVLLAECDREGIGDYEWRAVGPAGNYLTFGEIHP